MDPSQRKNTEAEVANFIYNDCISSVNNSKLLNIILPVRNDEAKLAKALQSRSVITKATMAALIIAFCEATNMSGPPLLVEDKELVDDDDDDDDFSDSVEENDKKESTIAPETPNASLPGDIKDTDPTKSGGSGNDWLTQLSRKKKQAAANAAKEEKNGDKKGKGGPFKNKNKKPSQTMPKAKNDSTTNVKACDAHSRGKCRFGYKGEKGVEKCPNFHQKVCSRHLTLLNPNGTGCNLSQKVCNYLHIRICKFSVIGKKCEDRSCIYRHTEGLYTHGSKKINPNKTPSQTQQTRTQPQGPSRVNSAPPKGKSQPTNTSVFRPPASQPPPQGMTWALVANPNHGVQLGLPQPPLTVTTKAAKPTAQEKLHTLREWNKDFVKKVEALLQE